MANQFYEDIAAEKSPDTLYGIVPGLFELFFDKKPEPPFILGAFLFYLLSWQSSWILSQRRFPFYFSYEGRLGELVAKQKAIEEQKKAQR